MKKADTDVPSLVDQLNLIINQNMSDGKLDEYEVPAFLTEPTEDEEVSDTEDEEEGLEDLDADFDGQFNDELFPSKDNWPIHQTGINTKPYGILRYNVDLYSQVASTKDAHMKKRLSAVVDELKKIGGAPDEPLTDSQGADIKEAIGVAKKLVQRLELAYAYKVRGFEFANNDTKRVVRDEIPPLMRKLTNLLKEI